MRLPLCLSVFVVVLSGTASMSADLTAIPSIHQCVFENRTTYGHERLDTCKYGRRSCANWEDIPFIKDTDYSSSDRDTDPSPFTLSLTSDKVTITWDSGQVVEFTDIFIGYDIVGGSKVVEKYPDPAYRSIVLHETGEMFSTYSDYNKTLISYGQCSPKK